MSDRVERLRGQSAYVLNRRLVSKLFVIVNVTTLFMELNRPADASPIKSIEPNEAPSSAVIAPPRPQPSDGRAGGQTSTRSPASSLDSSALLYLQRYGYMGRHTNSEANNLISEESFSDAISSFQRFAGIPETGTVDNQTLRYMQIPRCGNADRPQLDASGANRGLMGLVRRKRFALQGSKWRRLELTYRISQYPSRFNGKRNEVDAQIERAFGIWSQVAPINFVVKRDGRVHIDIRFASGDHGDGDAFDGPGNTLAHAYFPQYGGDAHFDDQEYWTVDSYAGTNIFQVAAHELGHSLGLGHSNVREALMAPFYQKYKPNFRLHADDVLAIQALYGEKPSSAGAESPVTRHSNEQRPGASPDQQGSIAPSPPPSVEGRESHDEHEATQPELPHLPDNGLGEPAAPEDGATLRNREPADLCTDPNIDAITRTEDGSSYVFKGDHYWLLTNEGLARGYPRRIAADWDGLTGPLDAALTWADGKTFFFKGNKYWRFRNKRRELGYPKLISAGFAGIPDDIDAAFVWSGNGRTYVFKGAEYWRFDSRADPPVGAEYPRPIKIWSGLPAHLNAAFKWENNVTYFFKGGQYYRFNDKDFKVESRGRPPFPRLAAEWWFGCAASSLAQRALPAGEGAPGRDPPQTDWSFHAGPERTARIPGTHISDHKPGSLAAASSASPASLSAIHWLRLLCPLALALFGPTHLRARHRAGGL